MNIIKNLGVAITLLLLPMISLAMSVLNVQVSKTELESQINK
jgi:cell division protein FtsL